MRRGRENRPASMPMPTFANIDASGKKAPLSTLTALIPINRQGHRRHEKFP